MRGVSTALNTELKKTAAQHRRSVNDEVLALLNWYIYDSKGAVKLW